jgi:hypothetical protein
MGEAVSSGPLINAGVKLLGSPGYPTIVEDFKNTLARQATYTPRYLGVIARGPVQHAHCLEA